MRKFLIFCGLWLGLLSSVFAAETLTFTDGTSVTGEIVKSDDNGAMIHTTTDSYPSYQWAQFSQESLKELAGNPKLRAYVEPFIEPTPAELPHKPEIRIRPIHRMLSPDELHPSIFGGLVHSSLGLFILLILYAANLYAAYEVGVVRGFSVPLVVACAVILPVVGPALFLLQPMSRPASENTPEEAVAGPGPAPAAAHGSAPAPGQEDIQIVSASWQSPKDEDQKPQAQVFARGKFNLNKRFIETKFAGFVGEPKGEAKKFSMGLKTTKGTFAVEFILQVGATEAIFETLNGQLVMPYADIQEIKLTPKPA